MKRPQPPLVRHQGHRAEIRPSTAHNFYAYFCEDCGVFVSWLSKQEVARARELDLLPDCYVSQIENFSPNRRSKQDDPVNNTTDKGAHDGRQVSEVRTGQIKG